MLSGYCCGPRRVPGVVKPANLIPLPQHDFSAPYKDAVSQHAYALLSCYNISTAELWLCTLPPAGGLPRGGIPRTHSKTGSREQKVQRKLQALASSAAVSLSALPLPQSFACSAFGSYSLIHFMESSLPVSLHLFSTPALLQPHLLQPFLSSLPLPFEITLSYVGFGSEVQICSSNCGSASRFSLILLPWLLCHAKHLGQCGCKM